jgi:hypothetical protein
MAVVEPAGQTREREGSREGREGELEHEQKRKKEIPKAKNAYTCEGRRTNSPFRLGRTLSLCENRRVNGKNGDLTAESAKA